MRRLFFVSVAAALLSASCVRQQRFRFVPAASPCFGTTAAGGQASAPTNQRPSLDCRHSQYTTAFIEFDSDGKAFDRNQEAVALKLIDAARANAPGGKVITVVYVHGWKNNAGEAPLGARPKDVEKFQNALLELGYRAAKAAASTRTRPVPVVGVYIGWRGKTLMGPNWFTFVSMWGRRNAANRIGNGPDLAPILDRIITKANEGSGASRVLLIGHSFGARVLEHAVEAGKVQLHDPVPVSGFVNPRVDLVLYVNSANDARRSLARLQSLRAAPVSVRHPDYDPAACSEELAEWSDADTELWATRCRDYPLLVAITSTGDLATKRLLPIANTINLDARKTLKAIPPTGDDFADPLPRPSAYQRSAAAHMPFLQSHTAREVRCPALPARTGRGEQVKTAEARRQLERALHPVCPATDANCRFVFRTLGDPPVCFQVDQRTAVGGKPPFNTTAFWIMDVEPSVIEDHGDIWNLSFVEMLGQLMAPRGFFEPAAGRIQLQAAPVRR